MARGKNVSGGDPDLKATSHSTTFDITMRPVREDQSPGTKSPTTFYPLKKARNSGNGNYSFEFYPLHTAMHRNRVAF